MSVNGYSANIYFKDCEEWLEDLAPLDPLDIASFVKHSGCRLMLGDKRKDEHDTTDLIAKFQVNSKALNHSFHTDIKKVKCRN